MIPSTKILVIEDEKLLRQEIIDWLTFEGYEALGAEDGIAGLEAAFRELPDLIICDITMPRLDGYGVLLEVHANPLTAFTPFIFLTAKASYEDMRKGMLLGADDYLTKPFLRLDLLLAIETRLKKRTALDDEHQQQVDLLQQLLANEREQRLLNTKLVAMFSHDFRSSLTGIVMSAHLLRRGAATGDQLRSPAHIDRIEACAQQLMQMLDDTLLIAQIETGKLNLQLEALDTIAFFRPILDEFSAIYGETHRIRYENPLTEPVMVDSRLLRHVAVNLISNALKYSPQSGEVRVSLSKQESQWTFMVQDQGIGIPEAALQHLFEPFYRAENVGMISGTGLGLALTKEVVDLQSGTIRVESEVGVGTTFTITLPSNLGLVPLQ